MRDLTQHLTTRADDSHAPPVSVGLFTGELLFFKRTNGMSSPGKVLRVDRIKPHAHRLCGPPSIPLSFTLASILPRRDTYRLATMVKFNTPRGEYRLPPLSIHRLRLGLLGYLIPFAPLAFVSQCQFRPSRVPSPLVFFPISAHFTATPGIPSAPTVL